MLHDDKTPDTDAPAFTADDQNPTAGTKSKPMKSDPADDATAEQLANKVGAELRQFVERVERLEAEKSDIAAQVKEVMAEAKGRGFDTKAIRKLIALRKRDANDVAEEEAILDLYKAALGMT